jgi:demethylmenaquinone methyltransferase/2-methoxy-6-polyprenyl-1,4-benzoquinol methylase
VAGVFERIAPSYDRFCRIMSLGSGRRYRRQALVRAGLAPGMRVLDLGTGTGLVARSALDVLGRPQAVVGLDPSRGMLRQARRSFPGPLIEGRAEALPVIDECVDLVSMGYALRHVADLGLLFAECRRVLRPGGRLVILELTRPRSAAGRWLLRGYLRQWLPLVMRLTGRCAEVGLATRYYWDTIDRCVEPGVIVRLMRQGGFAHVERRVCGAWLSEYVGVKAADDPSSDREASRDPAQAVTAQDS